PSPGFCPLRSAAADLLPQCRGQTSCLALASGLVVRTGGCPGHQLFLATGMAGSLVDSLPAITRYRIVESPNVSFLLECPDLGSGRRPRAGRGPDHRKFTGADFFPPPEKTKKHRSIVVAGRRCPFNSGTTGH